MKKSLVLTMSMASLVAFPMAVSAQTVDLKYEKKYVGIFKGHLVASDLKPNHRYVWTLNGVYGHSSNKVLADECAFWPPTQEGFCDFGPVSTDANGALDVNLSEELPPGKYRVKWLLKDTSNWNVIWHNDFVRFKVQ